MTLQKGETVWIIDIETEGVITEKLSHRSYMVQTPYNFYRQNRRDLTPLANQETASSVDNPIPTPIEIPDETFITVSDENLSVVQTRSGRVSIDLLYGLLKVNDQQLRTNIHTLCGYITQITYKPNVHISLLK